MEEIPLGTNLDWLESHFQSQLINPQSLQRGGPPQILTIHPTESSRRETLNQLASIGDEGVPIDRSVHHTLDSLISSLHSELRQPRCISETGEFNLLLHTECTKAAKKLAFPLMHSSPKQHWGWGKTRDLMNMNKALSEELITTIVSPDLDSFQKILSNLAKKLGGIHPVEQLSIVVKILESVSKEKVPFGLTKIDGIILLNHSPTMTPMRQRLIRALNRFKPIHVLSYAGSYRLGIHGFVPDDISPIRRESDLPEWVPKHIPWTGLSSETSESKEGDVKNTDNQIRLLVPRIERSIEATHALIDAAINSENPPESILIVDPSSSSNIEIWTSMIKSFGYELPSSSISSRESPGVHWLSAFVSLPHYEDAWSLSQLRAIAIQKTLHFHKDWLSSDQHPTIGNLQPSPDVEILEDVSRGFHLLGGQGALSRWLHALSRKPLANTYQDEDELGFRHESTQWWLLSLANRLKPLLSSIDVKAIENPKFSIGCYSGEKLPLPNPNDSGDEWFSDFGKLLMWGEFISILDGDINRTIMGLQELFDKHHTLRKSQRMLNHQSPKGGIKWVNEIIRLIDSSTLPGKRNSESFLRLLTPTQALGCRADLVILCHLDSESWNTSPSSIPGLSENERSELGVLQPDNFLRDARHAWNHLLNCGKEVIVLDSTIDESSNPSTPLSEWLSSIKNTTSIELKKPSFISDDDIYSLGGDNESRWAKITFEEGEFLIARPSEVITSKGGNFELIVTGNHQRDIRQRSGISLHKARNPLQPILNPSSVTISLDNSIIEDRIARQPQIAETENPYLSNSRMGEIVTIDSLRLNPYVSEKISPPRFNEDWPTIGLKVGKSKALSIDPRPLFPESTKLDDHDRRNGFLDGPTKETKIWSPSRLTNWLTCPRKGWLSSRLRAETEDDEDDDVDVRTRGLLIHGVWAELICRSLNMKEGVERNNLVPHSLASAQIDENYLRSEILNIVDEKAPWLRRSDAIATVRRLDLVGLDLNSYEEALEGKCELTTSGRFGRLLDTELSIGASALIAIEWPLTSKDGASNILLQLPEKSESNVNGIRLRGVIDRVELIPNSNGEFENKDGKNEVCPLDLDYDEDWEPRRLVVIRDLKSLEGPGKGKAGKRHRKELLEGIQLALYARAWEVSHPGDRVVGVGIAEIGEESCLYIESDPEYQEYLKSLEIGIIDCNTNVSFRRPNESSKSPKSNSFRAWMRHRLTAALRINQMSESGNVIPTPSALNCSYCSVKQICGLAPTVGGDSKWT